MIYQVSFIHRFTLGAEEELRRTEKIISKKNQFQEQIYASEDAGGASWLSLFAGAGEAAAAVPNVATIPAASL
jgi:hypothetical protein